VIATIETTRDRLPAVLALVASELRTPRFDSTEFEKLKQEQLAALEQSKSEPQTRAFVGVQQRMKPIPQGTSAAHNTPRKTSPTSTAVTIDQVRQFHRDSMALHSATWRWLAT